jgi:large subunit ribosomal protein L25
LDKVGILMNIISEIEVEALPAELPEKIEVNVQHLANIGDQIAVADLKVPEGVTVLTEAEQVVTKIAELVTKEAQEQAAAEAAAAAEASAEAAPEGAVEGEAPAEGVVPAEGGEKPAEVKEEAKPEA